MSRATVAVGRMKHGNVVYLARVCRCGRFIEDHDLTAYRSGARRITVDDPCWDCVEAMYLQQRSRA